MVIPRRGMVAVTPLSMLQGTYFVILGQVSQVKRTCLAAQMRTEYEVWKFFEEAQYDNFSYPCLHCRKTLSLHAGAKCLFEPTEFEAIIVSPLEMTVIDTDLARYRIYGHDFHAPKLGQKDYRRPWPWHDS